MGNQRLVMNKCRSMLLQNANLQVLEKKDLHYCSKGFSYALEDNAVNIVALINHATNTT